MGKTDVFWNPHKKVENFNEATRLKTSEVQNFRQANYCNGTKSKKEKKNGIWLIRTKARDIQNVIVFSFLGEISQAFERLLFGLLGSEHLALTKALYYLL